MLVSAKQFPSSSFVRSGEKYNSGFPLKKRVVLLFIKLPLFCHDLYNDQGCLEIQFAI